MEDEHKININNIRTTSFLLAPLDWGLGHTTRCLPIIKRLQEQNINVQVACNARQAQLIKGEFPSISIVPLEGYDLTYGSSRISTVVTIILQIPKILSRINREKQWLARFLSQNKIDAVISDSRFGFNHSSTYSIFITHQLRIKSPFGKWIEDRLQKWNLSFINRFNECWVMDFEGDQNLAGDLSHTKSLPSIPTKCIGAVSRFKNADVVPANSLDVLVILSGPEPQRSLFENLMRKDLENFKGTFVMAKDLSTPELEKNIQRAKYVISRTGYTTVMDMVAMKKKSILIPTPGQSEQEYLAMYLTEKKLALCIPQKEFNLEGALERAAKFEYADVEKFDFSQYQRMIDQFLVDQNFLGR